MLGSLFTPEVPLGSTRNILITCHVSATGKGKLHGSPGCRTLRSAVSVSEPATTTDLRKSCKPVIGYSSIHSVVDDHSRLAYSEVLTDERQHTATSESLQPSRRIVLRSAS